MKKSPELLLRIVIVLFFVILIISAPAILFPFGISLIIAILLTPLAEGIQKYVVKIGIKRFPYDFSIIISFCLFLGILYMIGIHIFVPFLSELSEFTKS